MLGGLDPNLNATSINGVAIASPEADRRSVALDVIPSELVETLTVSKTLNADMPADAIGGSIDIQSLSAFDREGMFYKVTANGNYSELQDETGHHFSGTFTNVFGKLGVAASYSNQERNFGSENIETDGGWEDDFEDDAGNEFIAHEEVEARDYEITREREGFALNLDYRVSEETLIYSRFLYSIFGDQEYRNRMEFKLDEGDFPEGNVSNTSLIAEGTELQRELKDRFEEQEIQSLVFGAETQISSWTLEGKIGFSSASEDEPNRVDSEFENGDVARAGYTSIGETPNLVISEDGLVPANYELKELVIENNFAEDDLFTLNFDAKYDTSIGGIPGFIKFGFALNDREKTNDGGAEVFEPDEEGVIPTWADFAGPSLDYDLANIGPLIDAGAIRAYANANRSAFEPDFVDSNNDYEIEEEVFALYVMNQLDFKDLRLTYGLRLEETDVVARGFNVIEGDIETVEPNEFEHDYSNLLPSLNARYTLSEELLLRGSYYQSIGRPSFGQLNPTHEDVELEDGEFVVEGAGNPELEPFEAQNIDFSIEYYPGGIGALSAGIFYKEIENFIFTADIADSVEIERFFPNLPEGTEVDEFVQPLNGDSATILGLEVSWTRAFENGLLIQTNATFSESEGDYPERAGEDLPMFGQSDAIGNFIIGYENKLLSLRLSTAYQSKRLIELGGDAFNDLYEDDHTQVDFSGKVNVSDSFQVFFNAKNLTDEPFYAYHGNTSRNGQYEEYGATFELGVTFKNQ